MTGPDEKTFWKGSPDVVAAALSPAMIVSCALAAAALHPTARGILEYHMVRFGLSGGDAVLASYSVGAAVAAKAIWAWLAEVTTRYELTSERLIVRHGVFLRTEDEIELYRVVDAVHAINLLQRLIGVGTVRVASTDRTGTVMMRSIARPDLVRNGLRRLAEQCKSRRGVRILE